MDGRSIMFSIVYCTRILNSEVPEVEQYRDPCAVKIYKYEVRTVVQSPKFE